MRVFLIVLVLLCSAPAVRGQFLGTFDTGNDGWRFVTLSSAFQSTPTINSGPSPAPHMTAYGNPPGCLGWTSDPAFHQYWITPAAWSGNRANWYGATVTWQYWYYSTELPGWDNGFGDIAIRDTNGNWLVADVTTSAPTMAPNNTDNTVWNLMSATLDTSTTWRVGNVSGPVATQTQIVAALQNLDYILIRAEARHGLYEAMRMDNFRLQPIPETSTLLSLGSCIGLGTAWLWRRLPRRRSE